MPARKSVDWLVPRLALRLRLSIKHRPASRRENHFGLTHCVRTLDLDETFNKRVIPDGIPGTGARPSLHSLSVGPWPASDPRQELQRQKSHGPMHREFTHTKMQTRTDSGHILRRFSEINTESAEESHNVHGGPHRVEDGYRAESESLISPSFSVILCVVCVALFGI